MSSKTSSEVRSAFLDFFRGKGHEVVANTATNGPWGGGSHLWRNPASWTSGCSLEMERIFKRGANRNLHFQSHSVERHPSPHAPSLTRSQR